MKYLKTYESVNIESKIDEILLQSEFMNDLSSCDNTKKHKLVYHSTKYDIRIKTQGFVELKNKFRDNPKDLNINIHNYVGELFVDKFGWNPRKESIFCHTGDLEDKREYGMPYIIVPIGDYQYVWNTEINDLYLYLWHKYHHMRPVFGGEYDFYNIPTLDFIKKLKDVEHSEKQNILKMYKDCKHYVDTCTNINLCEYLKHPFEIMIKADSYYLIDIIHEPYIIKRMQEIYK